MADEGIVKGNGDGGGDDCFVEGGRDDAVDAKGPSLGDAGDLENGVDGSCVGNDEGNEGGNDGVGKGDTGCGVGDKGNGDCGNEVEIFVDINKVTDG